MKRIKRFFRSGKKRRADFLHDIVVNNIKGGHFRLTEADLKRAVENRQIEISNNRIK